MRSVEKRGGRMFGFFFLVALSSEPPGFDYPRKTLIDTQVARGLPKLGPGVVYRRAIDTSSGAFDSTAFLGGNFGPDETFGLGGPQPKNVAEIPMLEFARFQSHQRSQWSVACSLRPAMSRPLALLQAVPRFEFLQESPRKLDENGLVRERLKTLQRTGHQCFAVVQETTGLPIGRQ